MYYYKVPALQEKGEGKHQDKSAIPAIMNGP